MTPPGARAIPDLIALPDILAARDRLADVAVRTPLREITAAELHRAGLPPLPFRLFLKLESLQPIGSFKLRGAYNMAAQLTEAERRPGLITYSSGNHAQGVAFAARALGVPAVIVMPDNAPAVKIEATRALGAEVVFVGPASSERRLRAEALAAEHGYSIVPPYDHPHIIAGQATCGLEIAEDLPEADLVLAPVSGGGLLSGVATALKLASSHPPVVWGAEPELAADAHESFTTRSLVEWPASLTSRTLGDGLRTQSLGQRNFEHILQFVDRITTVSEEQIVQALRAALSIDPALSIEPSGAVTLAAALFTPLPPSAGTVVAVISGGNIDPGLRSRLLSETHPAASTV